MINLLWYKTPYKLGFVRGTLYLAKRVSITKFLEIAYIVLILRLIANISGFIHMIKINVEDGIATQHIEMVIDINA